MAKHRTTARAAPAVSSNDPGHAKTPAAAVYARGADEGSIESQLSACRSHAAAIGALVCEEVIDTAHASTVERHGFQRLLEIVSRREADIVIIEDLHRLSRGAIDLHAFNEHCGSSGVSLQVAGRGPIRDADAVDGVLSRINRDNMDARMSSGRRAAAMEGRVSARPFGYASDPDQPGVGHVHSQRAADVRELYERHDAGVQPAELARWMDGRHPTPAACSRIDRGEPYAGSPRWTPRMVTDILRSPFYTGSIVIEAMGIENEAALTGPATSAGGKSERFVTKREELRIVSAELWQRAQERLAARRDCAKRPSSGGSAL